MCEIACPGGSRRSLVSGVDLTPHSAGEEHVPSGEFASSFASAARGLLDTAASDPEIEALAAAMVLKNPAVLTKALRMAGTSTTALETLDEAQRNTLAEQLFRQPSPA